MVEAGACELCVQILHEYPARQGIQKAGLSLIANLAYCFHGAQSDLGSAGACEAVVAAMKRCPQERFIQLYGCMGIRNLAMDHPVNVGKLRAAHARLAVCAAQWTFSGGGGGSGRSAGSSAGGAHEAAAGPKTVQHWAKLALEVVPKSSVPLMSLVVRDAMSRFREYKRQALEDERAGLVRGGCLL